MNVLLQIVMVMFLGWLVFAGIGLILYIVSTFILAVQDLLGIRSPTVPEHHKEVIRGKK